MDLEIWLPVKDFPRYEVSSYGRVKRLDKITGKSIIKEWDINLNKYITCRFSNDHTSILKNLHIIIMQTFQPTDNPLLEVNHKDLRKSNNHLYNLEWVTHSKNIKHAVDNGALVSKKGSDHHAFGKPTSNEVKNKMKASHNKDGNHPNYKLTNNQVYDIKKRRFEGSDLETLAKEYNQTIGNISSICSGKRRNSIAPEYTTKKSFRINPL